VPGKPAAKRGDKVVATDTHIILVPAAAGAPVPTPVPLPFAGVIQSGCVETVKINNMAAAVVGSGATNTPPHIPPGNPFAKPPTNMGTIITGSGTVHIGGKPAARAGDTAITCNDPVDLPNGKVVAVGTVMIGG
jgi:uncharacterized Zn-binding protein involved in type VI secretion